MSDFDRDPDSVDEICPKNRPTLCDGDTRDNHWFEGGVCMLDELSKAQIVYSIEHNPKARVDLRKVTTNEEVLALLDHVPLLATAEEADRDMKILNKGDILPQYTVFRGNFNNM